MTGTLSWDRRRLIRYALTTVVLTVAVIGGARVLFDHALPQHYSKDEVLEGMHLLTRPVPAVVHREPQAVAGSAGGSALDDIRARGRLRVGYLKDSLPFAFFNSRDELVGFDVDLAHRMGAELGVSLEFVPIRRETLADSLRDGACDILMSGLVVTPLRATETLLSRSYLDETLGLLVQDADRGRFQTWDDVRAAGPLTIAVPNLSYYVDKMRQLAPQATIVTIDDVGGAVDRLDHEVDAMLLPAERGSAWTLIYPRFTMVVPGPAPIRMPLAYPIARHDQGLANFVDTWISLKQKDGTIDALYDYWILGRSAVRPGRRWSVIKDVLHWEH